MIARPTRILALDLGDARIGLAISDPLGLTAQPAGFIERKGFRQDLQRLRTLIRERKVDRVVIGHPLHLSGKAGERARLAREFAERLARVLDDVEIELWDERLTTVEAERVMKATGVRKRKRRVLVDALSAVIILSSYMEARSSADRGSKRHPEPVE